LEPSCLDQAPVIDVCGFINPAAIIIKLSAAAAIINFFMVAILLEDTKIGA
jgi:hypothetical protein